MEVFAVILAIFCGCFVMLIVSLRLTASKRREHEQEQRQKQLEAEQERQRNKAAQEAEQERLKKIEDAKPVTSKLLILPQELNDKKLINALSNIGYLKKSSWETRYSEVNSQAYQLERVIKEAEKTGSRVTGGKQQTMKKIKDLKEESSKIYHNMFAEQYEIIKKLKKQSQDDFIEILLSAPQKEEKLKEVFSRYNIKILANVRAIEDYKRQEEQKKRQKEDEKRQEREKKEREKEQREQEKQYKKSILALRNVLKYKLGFDIYEYFISDTKCKFVIGNFIKQNTKTMENIILGNEFDNTFLETISMLTNVLIENTNLDLETAKRATHKAVMTTLLNEWKANFKEHNRSFCREIKTDNKDDSIKLFASNFDKSKTLQKTMYSFFLILNNIEIGFNTNISNLHRVYKKFEIKLNDEYEKAKETVVYENFKAAIFTHIDTNKDGESFTIDDIDGMDGAQFEHYIAKLFEKMGYETEVTKHSGDQGIDVLAKNDIVTIGIQAKCYSGTVPNSAVQEAVGGKALYKVDKVMVITNNEFTPSAKQLAKANSVELWDRSKLEEKIRQYAV